MKKEITSSHFTGERALFQTSDALIDGCLFDDGESSLKESSLLEVKNTTFGWKYPLWYGRDITVTNCTFTPEARAGVWYTENSSFDKCVIKSPKLFRRCTGLKLSDIDFLDASETLWFCQGVTLKNIKADKPYFGLQCHDVTAENLHLEGDYGFDGCKNLTIRNSVLKTKDAFWNCDTVTLENCHIDGEYFGWNSKNMVLINCTVSSHQGFCYIQNLILRNCVLSGSDLILEYCSNVDAEIVSDAISIKNPISGRIKVQKVDELIQDDPKIDVSQVEIEVGE